jgi:hypothetical protein
MRVLQGMQTRTSRQGAGDAVIDDCLAVLASLTNVAWPARPAPVVEGLQKDFKKRFFQTTVTFLRIQSQSPLVAPFHRGLPDGENTEDSTDQNMEQKSQDSYEIVLFPPITHHDLHSNLEKLRPVRDHSTMYTRSMKCNI